MIVEGKVGPQVLSDGAGPNAVRQGRTGEVNVSDAHARYQEAVARGAVFGACNQAAVALSVLSATATGLILTNPAGSGKNLVILTAGFQQTTLQAASVVGLAVNNNPAAAAVAHTTPATIRNALIGGSPAAGVALVDTAATLPAAPVLHRTLGALNITASTNGMVLKDEIAGEIVLAPGTALSFTATVAASGLASLSWEEVPI